MTMTTSSASRTIQAPATLIRSLLAAAAGDRPAPAAIEVLRQAGFDSGESVLASLRDHLSDRVGSGSLTSLPAAEFWEGLSTFCEEMGWGRLSYQDPHQGVGELRAEEWFEAESETSSLGCQFTTGLLASLLRELVGDDVAVMEGTCRGRGEAHCRYVFGAPTTLDIVHRALSSGADLDAALRDLA